jgi:hypothetical protein
MSTKQNKHSQEIRVKKDVLAAIGKMNTGITFRAMPSLNGGCVEIFFGEPTCFHIGKHSGQTCS